MQQNKNEIIIVNFWRYPQIISSQSKTVSGAIEIDKEIKSVKCFVSVGYRIRPVLNSNIGKFTV